MHTAVQKLLLLLIIASVNTGRRRTSTTHLRPRARLVRRRVVWVVAFPCRSTAADGVEPRLCHAAERSLCRPSAARASVLWCSYAGRLGWHERRRIWWQCDARGRWCCGRGRCRRRDAGMASGQEQRRRAAGLAWRHQQLCCACGVTICAGGLRI